ncbi:MAG TPA: type VI secretion system-associated FHA domain protein [Allosphingosinicella sp.]|nr:type VI secretion system-associated FHA domain protein [Allosphingosinicella sp.]
MDAIVAALAARLGDAGDAGSPELVAEATLKAIPGALRATLDRFSPGSIQRRHGGDLGLLAKLLPVFRDAALWRHYERQFDAVTEEPDEAFMDVFAREFRKAYERELDEGSDG